MQTVAKPELTDSTTVVVESADNLTSFQRRPGVEIVPAVHVVSKNSVCCLIVSNKETGFQARCNFIIATAEIVKVNELLEINQVSEQKWSEKVKSNDEDPLLEKSGSCISGG